VYRRISARSALFLIITGNERCFVHPLSNDTYLCRVLFFWKHDQSSGRRHNLAAKVFEIVPDTSKVSRTVVKKDWTSRGGVHTHMRSILSFFEIEAEEWRNMVEVRDSRGRLYIL
jgi:hypothetical protein